MWDVITLWVGVFFPFGDGVYSDVAATGKVGGKW